MICLVLAFWVLAFMLISVQDVFPQVVKAILLPILVMFPLDGGILDFLDIKSRNLNGYAFNRESTADFVDKTMVSIELVSNTWC